MKKKLLCLLSGMSHFIFLILLSCEHCSIMKNECRCAVDVAEQCACSSTA